MTMISVKDLKKTFGKNRVLRDIDVEIDEGEIVVVVGSSGSGKSTFLRCLNLLEEPTSGEIIVDGVNITDPHVNLNTLRQTIGMVFQQFNLFPNLSVIENIKLAPKKLRKLSDKKATRLARGLLDDVGLLDKAEASPDSLSGGQKQRLSIARAIATNAPILIFDDSFSALDYKTDSLLRAELTKKTKNQTKFIVAQRVSSIASADHIIVLDDGKISAHGKHGKLLKTSDLYREIASSQLSDDEIKKQIKAFERSESAKKKGEK